MYQQLIIVGYLGKDPVMRFTPDGKAVTNFSVATSRSWTQGGIKNEETTWFRITVWEKQAEACNQWLHKGSPVLIVGRLSPDKDTGGPRIYQRSDGTMGAQFEVTATTVKFLPKGKESNDNYQDAPESDVDEEEIPFN